MSSAAQSSAKRTRPARKQQTVVNKDLPVEVPVVSAPEPVAAPAVANAAPVESAKPSKLQISVIPESRIKGQLLEATAGSIMFEAGETKASLVLLRDARKALESGSITETVVSTLPLPEGAANDAKPETKREQVSRPINATERAEFEQVVAQSSPQESHWVEVLHALKNERTRLAEDAVLALTITVEETLKQIIGHTVLQTFASNLKTLMVEHIHRGGIENLSLYPLFKNLPSFASEAAKHAAFNKEAEWNAKLKAALTQAERDFKKKYSLPPKSVAKVDPAAKNEVAKAKVEVADTVEQSEEVDGPTSVHFIKKLYNDMAEHEPAYKSARVSAPCKQYLAQLANELVRYLAPLISIVADAMKTKTVSKAAVLCVVKSLLVAGRPTVDKFELNHALCDDVEFARVEAAKKKADPSYVKLETPKVNKLVAVHTLSFPGNAFDNLEKTVEEKLQQKHSKKEASA